MVTGTYRGVTVRVSDEVAQGLPATFNMSVQAAPVTEPATVPVEEGSETVQPDPVDADPVEPAPQAPAPQAPAKTASRGEWAKYAESIGIDPGDMTRAELITATNRAELITATNG